MKSNNFSGFSLIELSIVLIIIGLLVAGVTGGASLIKSAQLRAVITEIRNYETAINAYYAAIGDLPGGLNTDQMSFTETGVAWQDLYDEGITNVEPTDSTSAATSMTSDYGMRSKIQGSYYVIGYNDAMEQNVLFLIANNGTPDTAAELTTLASTGSLSNASITRRDATFLDDKIDNGVKDSGIVWSFNGGSGAGCVYDTTDATKDCAIAFGIGI
jgi:prepilin-type N-terminal cleavage/methylation domain-containing protein